MDNKLRLAIHLNNLDIHPLRMGRLSNLDIHHLLTDNLLLVNHILLHSLSLQGEDSHKVILLHSLDTHQHNLDTHQLSLDILQHSLDTLQHSLDNLLLEEDSLKVIRLHRLVILQPLVRKLFCKSLLSKVILLRQELLATLRLQVYIFFCYNTNL